MATTESETQSVVYERIVVPLDGSELAEYALAHAEAVARTTGAPMHLVQVVDAPPLTRVGTVGLGVEQAALSATLKRIEAEEATAAEYLAALRERLVERGLVTTTTVVTGEVVPELLGIVQPQDLLMTTHGRTGLARWFFGSVAEAVIRHSPAPCARLRRRPRELHHGTLPCDRYSARTNALVSYRADDIELFEVEDAEAG